MIVPIKRRKSDNGETLIWFDLAMGHCLTNKETQWNEESTFPIRSISVNLDYYYHNPQNWPIFVVRWSRQERWQVWEDMPSRSSIKMMKLSCSLPLSIKSCASCVAPCLSLFINFNFLLRCFKFSGVNQVSQLLIALHNIQFKAKKRSAKLF